MAVCLYLYCWDSFRYAADVRSWLDALFGSASVHHCDSTDALLAVDVFIVTLDAGAGAFETFIDP